MKKGLFILFFLLGTLAGYSNHIVGYDLALVNITGTDSYKFKLKLYRENIGASTNLPSTVQFRIHNKQTNANTGIILNVPKITSYFANMNPKGCVLIPGQNNFLEVGEYEYLLSETTMLSLSSADGYYLIAEMCCRNSTINAPTSDQFQFLFTMDFPSLGALSQTRYNSSPEFDEIPAYVYGVGKLHTLDWSATDADGDSLVYSITGPLGDASFSHPFSSIDYTYGYKLDSNIADGAPDFSIDSITGVGSYKPTQAGRYLVAVKVEEYRNGIKIGQVRREIQFITLIIIEHPPVLKSNNLSAEDIVDTIDFAGSISVDYSLQFFAKDSSIDSLFMYVIPGGSSGLNVFEPIILKAEWGAIGNTQTGSAVTSLLLDGQGTLSSEFKWKIYDYMGRSTPYRFSVVVKDQSCPDGLKDTINVTIYVPVTGCFVNQIQTLNGCDSVLGINGKWYYSSGTYYEVERVDFACDTTYLQYITIVKSPKKKGILGESFAKVFVDYTYYLSVDRFNECYWWVDNGTVVFQQDSFAVIRFENNAMATVTVTEFDHEGCSTENIKLVNVSGLGIQHEKNDSINIYPNPSTTKIHIDGLIVNGSVVEIFSIDGRKLFSDKVSNDGAIDISAFNTGVYILKVEGLTKKFIKL